MASITCRAGETFPDTHSHRSVAEVRECYNRYLRGATPTRDQFNQAVRKACADKRNGAGATQPTDYQRTYHTERYQDLPTLAGSVWGEVRATGRQVAEGRYALRESDGVTRFYVVQKGKEGGQWAGRTFVKIQASDELHSIKNPTRLLEVLRAISADPKAAMLRYGQHIGSCGHCGRTLTDEESRAYGIGPVCRRKLGW